MRISVEIEVPGIGEKIREARERDDRSLAAICREVGMSRFNWYRTEKEEGVTPLTTLRKMESVLGIDLGLNVDRNM